MKYILLISTFLLSLCVTASADPLTQLDTKDVPLIDSDGHCGGAFVGRTLVSAVHCLPSSGTFRVVDPNRAGQKGDIVFRASDAIAFQQQDVFVMPPLNRDSGYKTLTLATAAPVPGDKIRIEGFPPSQADFLDHYPKALDCILLGPGLGYVGLGDLNVIDLAAKCPALEDLEGFSGGPVLNARGEMVGVVSNGSLHPKNGFSYVFFSPFSAVPQSAHDPVLFFKDGPIHFGRFFMEASPDEVFSADAVFKNGWLNGPFTVRGPIDSDRATFVNGKTAQ